MNVAAGYEATADNLAKNMILMSLFWDRSDYRPFRTLGRLHASSMETCRVFRLFSWVEYFPSARLQKGFVDSKVSAEPPHLAVRRKWVKFQFWMNYCFNCRGNAAAGSVVFCLFFYFFLNLLASSSETFFFLSPFTFFGKFRLMKPAAFYFLPQPSASSAAPPSNIRTLTPTSGRHQNPLSVWNYH